MDPEYVPDEDEDLDNNDDDMEYQEDDDEDDYDDDDESFDEDEDLKKNTKKKSTKTKKNTQKKSRKSNSNAKKMSTSSINSEYLADIKQTFNRFDPDQNGYFDIKQLKFAMRALGFEPKKEEIKTISKEFEKNGQIYYKDFEQLMIKRIQEKTINDEIMKAFQLFDVNKTGKITFDDLKRVSNELGEKITDEELNEMIQEADLDGDKAVNCQEFLRIMKKTFLY